MSKKITLTIEVTWDEAILTAYPDAENAMEALRDDLADAVWDHIGDGMFCDLPEMDSNVPDQLQMEIIKELSVQIDDTEYTDPFAGYEEGGLSTDATDETVPFLYNRKNEA